MPATKLSRDFYARETLLDARDLLGMHLVHAGPEGEQVGRIVETEAYKGPHDLAAHSSRGRTRRTEVMFGPPGHAYVYLIYGFWNCLNIVTAADGTPHAVLLRGLEPVQGLTSTTHAPGPVDVPLVAGLWERLNIVRAADGPPHAVLLRGLGPVKGITSTTHGPGLLCRALHIDRGLNGTDLLGNTLWLEKPARYRPPK